MLPPTDRSASEFYHSEARTYVFDDMEYSKSRDLGEILHQEMRSTRFIDEAIALLVSDGGGSAVSRQVEPFLLSTGLRRGGVVIKTELVYRTEGKLYVAEITTDAWDELLPVDQQTTLQPLATFSKVELEVLMDIHPLNQIGVDPQFLYRFGDNYGRRLR